MLSRGMERETTISAPHEIKGRRLLLFSLLPMGNNFINGFYLSYSYFYYVYVVGLDSLLTSAGIIIFTLVSAIGYIVFGIISDNRPLGRHGKRKPLLLYGLPFFVIPGILIWVPPVMCLPGVAMNWAVALYMWVMGAVFAIGITVNFASYNAMIPEQLETEENRQEAAKLQGLLNLIAITFGIAVPFILQSFLADPDHTHWTLPSGQFLITETLIIAIILGVIAVVTTVITYRTVDESFLDKDVKRKSIGAMFKDMQYPLKHKNARNFFGVMLSWNMGGKIFTTLPIPFFTFVLQAKELTFITYMLVVLIVDFASLFLWAKIVKRQGTIKANNTAFLVIIAALLSFALLFIDIPDSARLAITMVSSCVVVFGIVASYLTPMPIISAIIDEAPNAFPAKEFKKETLSGLYTGMNSLFVNIACALGTLFMGIYFSGGNERNVFLLILIFPLIAVIYVFGWVCNKRLSLASQGRPVS
jgi:Na+/melibiose symporter-like transporter